MPIMRTRYIYVSNDVRIRDNCSETNGVRKQKNLGNTALGP